ncbi:hypothetical protein J2T09_002364 [Neorhizobium huautlense]|uniref:Uncharacterized protein n=1 Tax=Neorhizobium huautlense TaxID=67774 RepID=A0ABT9PT20_9HYPH|nr:hypothetical protein [Neorhizobium huautlense]MDP9837612.1 hypothetical protein [Neorhizobium huautlense]
MVERVFIGNDNGVFKMRISRPGINARTATLQECTIHEEMSRPLTYVATGLVNVPPGTSVSVSLGRTFAAPPVFIIKHESHRLLAVQANLNMASGNLQLVARADAVGSLVRYVILAP